VNGNINPGITPPMGLERALTTLTLTLSHSREQEELTLTFTPPHPREQGGDINPHSSSLTGAGRTLCASFSHLREQRGHYAHHSLLTSQGRKEASLRSGPSLSPKDGSTHGTHTVRYGRHTRVPREVGRHIPPT